MGCFCDLARATSSCTVLACTEGCTTSHIGTTTARDTGWRSRKGSYGSDLNRCGAVVITLESLMRTVRPSGGDLAVRSAAVVLPAPGRFSTTNCWPSAPLHFAARMRASVSGLPPGARPTRTRTGFCGQACASAAPDQAAAITVSHNAMRFMLPPSDLGVNAQKIGNRLRRSPPETTFGGDAEIPRISLPGREAPSRPSAAVRIVHQAEEEPRARVEFEAGERCEVGVVAAAGRHRHVQGVDRAREPRLESVVDLDHVRGAVRLLP